MSHLSCLAILQPSVQNIEFLCVELSKNPHFKDYKLFFTSPIDQILIRQLAESDQYCLVEKIEEIYLNYFPQHPSIFTTSSTLISQSICSFVASLGYKLNVRYFSDSNPCLHLAQNIIDTFKQFNSISKDSITLIIIDRLIDPITPILHSWFYISAIHDLFFIKDNVFQIPDKEDETVLNFRTDNFLRTFGSRFLSDVGPAVAQELQEVVSMGRNANDVLQQGTDNMVQAFYATTQ